MGRKKSFAGHLFCYVILVSTRSETDREMKIASENLTADENENLKQIGR